MRKLPDELLHNYIARAIELRSSLLSHRASDWRTSEEKVAGYSLPALYLQAYKRRVGDRPFFGCGNWNAYLRKRHSVTLTGRTLQRLSDNDLHSAVSEAIQQVGVTSSKQWDHSQRTVQNGQTLGALYSAVVKRKRRGKPFFGFGTWNSYLERVHGVVPLDQNFWVDERLHRTIAVLVQRFPPEKISWSRANRNVALHGKTLANLYYLAWRSNRPKAVKHSERRVRENFFGHGSWKKYAHWVKKEYG